jgi:hypothetical protein
MSIADEFTEVLRVKREAEAKLVGLFEDVDSGYLNWVLLNIDNDRVCATARYHLDLRAARDQEAVVRGPEATEVEAAGRVISVAGYD